MSHRLAMHGCRIAAAVVTVWTLQGTLCLGVRSDTAPSEKGSRYGGMQSQVQGMLAEKGVDMSVPSLLKALGAKDAWERDLALMALSHRATAAEVPAMKGMVTSADASTRLTAIYALNDVRKRLGEKQSGVSRTELAAAARLLFNDPQAARVRVDSAEQLLYIADDPTGYPVAMAAITSPDPNQRAPAIATAEYFAMRGVRDANGRLVDWVTPLAAIVKDQGMAESTRLGTATTLMSIGTSQARAALDELAVTVENEKVRTTIKALRAGQTGRGEPLSGVMPHAY